MSARKLLVAGNWKLNGSRESVASLAKAVVDGAATMSCEVLVCPTFVHLADVQSVVGNSAVALGAQNCSVAEEGAYTGEVSSPMIKAFGAQYVIVGHSERRAMYAESSALVAQKAQAVQLAGMQPIVCVGETLEQREAGQLQAVLDEQLDAVIDVLGMDGEASGMRHSVIAYEPVWAIGTGRSATSEQAQEVHAMIRQKLSTLHADVAQQVRILYGGSVKPDNAQELFSQPDIDGGLIGGAALKADSFLGICSAAV